MKIIVKLPIEFDKVDKDGDYFQSGCFGKLKEVPLLLNNDFFKIIGKAKPFIKDGVLMAEIDTLTDIGYGIIKRNDRGEILEAKLIECSLITRSEVGFNSNGEYPKYNKNEVFRHYSENKEVQKAINYIIDKLKS